MPTYTVTDPQSGRRVRLTGESAPTAAELETLFAAPASKGNDKDWIDSAVDALPTVGGLAGSFVGAGKWNPLGMAGAAIGGAGGEFVRQIVQAARGKTDDVPNSIAGQYEEALKQGAMQAGLEGGGRAVFGGGARVLKGVQKMTLPAIPRGVQDMAVDAALDLVPGGRMMRAGTKAAVKAMRGAAPEAEAPVARRAVESLPEGFDRYLPNVSAPPSASTVASLTRNAPHVRALSAGEEHGINELDDLMERLHGADYQPKGNGLYREPAAELARSLGTPTHAEVSRVVDPDLERGRELGRLLQKLASGRGGT